MKWPWVSRLAFDVIAGERDRLASQVDRLTDHLTRRDRVEAGLPETPPKPKKQLRVPPDIEAMIRQFGSQVTQDQLRRKTVNALKQGKDPDSIRRMLREAGAESEDADG